MYNVFDVFTLQLCSEVLDCLKRGLLGPCSDAVVQDYRAACHERFPLAAIFVDKPEPIPNDIDCTNNTDICTGGVESGLPNGDTTP